MIFESRFESGNLLGAVKVSEDEYDLILQNDINTNGKHRNEGNTNSKHRSDSNTNNKQSATRRHATATATRDRR